MSIYTKTGDKGETSLASGERVMKDSLRLEAYGTVDELSSAIGLLIAMMDADEHLGSADVDMLMEIQNTLFRVGGTLAGCPCGEMMTATRQIESEIDKIQAIVPAVHSFILPGGTLAAGQAHVCRTICRRAERHIVALSHSESVEDDILIYVNRLSDFLFCLARKFNFVADKSENNAVFR
ncbi:MAG: cob(I)yrinic acid a,c-diamide adenosyltransferase [Prevotella sp.]|nr:cob(I)yrinic acid a,c-diamide adenosyltransferase [Prevotella sp.]